MKRATYTEDTEEVSIWFEHTHEYVKSPEFQLEIWRDKLADKVFLTTICWFDLTFPKKSQFWVLLTNKQHLCFLSPQPIRPIIEYKNFSISRDRLVGDGVYYTRVRAKPCGYFNGDWSEWSSSVSFTIKSEWIWLEIRCLLHENILLCLVWQTLLFVLIIGKEKNQITLGLRKCLKMHFNHY